MAKEINKKRSKAGKIRMKRLIDSGQFDIQKEKLKVGRDKWWAEVRAMRAEIDKKSNTNQTIDK